MKTLIKKLTVSSALIAVVITGCKKDPNDESPKPASQEQDLALVFKNVAGTSDVDFISAYTTNSSQKYTLSTVRFYMSGISLIKSDGSEYPLTGQYLLVDPSTSHFHLGKVPVGSKYLCYNKSTCQPNTIYALELEFGLYIYDD
jgi:hypothetical protein